MPDPATPSAALAPVNSFDPRRLGVLFLVGAVVGTLGDRVHTFSRVLDYKHPFLFGEAWWVPLLMGAAGILLPVGHAFLRKRFAEPADGTTRDVIIAGVWFAAAYVASGLFMDYPGALAILFSASFIARALSSPPSRTLWLFALCTGLGGTLWEMGLSGTGAFTYLRPGPIGRVPLWLPGLYVQLALLVRAIDRRWPDVPDIKRS